MRIVQYFLILSVKVTALFQLTWSLLQPWEVDRPTTHPESSSDRDRWQVFGVAAFLVTVPVFFQAPLVRWSPELGLFSTVLWWLAAALWHRHSPEKPWGRLIYGFSFSWLAGSIYWGWWRTEPLLHLPIEAIALPLALWGLWHNRAHLGYAFYLGSLLGTTITDLYFYPTQLIPYWRQVMALPPEQLPTILQGAVAQLQSVTGVVWAIALILFLLIVGLRSLQKPTLAAWAFGGAVLSTLLVDSLFLGSVYFLL